MPKMPNEDTQWYRILKYLCGGKSGYKMLQKTLASRGATRVKELIKMGWGIKVINNPYISVKGKKKRQFQDYELIPEHQKLFRKELPFLDNFFLR